MKAVIVREHGGFEALRHEELPTPEPAADQVRVAVRACGINHLDVWMRRGVPGHAFPLPLIPGNDVAGIVDALGPGLNPETGFMTSQETADSATHSSNRSLSGPGTRTAADPPGVHPVHHPGPSGPFGTAGLRVGDAVVVAPGVSCGGCLACLSGRDHHCRHYGILGEHRHGGCAQYVVVPRQNVFPKPAALSFIDVAAAGIAHLTAWNMLVRRAEIRPGETVLVQAAGSGVGSAAVQIAKLWQARVIATASTDKKLERARSLGADHVINYTHTDVAREIRRLTDNRGADIVIEHVGASTWQGSMRSLAWQGRLVTCGATAGHEVDLNLRHVFFKSLSVLGSTMGSKGDFLEVLQHLAAGRLRTVVDRVFPLCDVAEAHRLLESRDVFGKYVISVDSQG